MRKVLTLAGAALLLAGSAMLANAEVKSLRGDVPLNAKPKPPKLARILTREGGFRRNFKQQPPLIPHEIYKERITLRVNTCLKCHAPENHKREDAPMISKTHFTDPAHPSEKNLYRGRWFCNQCHVPQLNLKPLVRNRFKPLGEED